MSVCVCCGGGGGGVGDKNVSYKHVSACKLDVLVTFELEGIKIFIIAYTFCSILTGTGDVDKPSGVHIYGLRQISKEFRLIKFKQLHEMETYGDRGRSYSVL